MLRTLRFINIRNETTKSTQIINVVILKNAFYFLDYAISLVRADWKGLDSLAWPLAESQQGAFGLYGC